MKTIIKYILLLTTTVLFWNCEGFIDESTSYNTLNPDNYPDNMAQLDYFLNAPYANTHCWEGLGFMAMGRFGYNIDRTGDLEWLGTADWNDLSTFQIKANNAYSESAWIGNYRGVQQSRTFIDNIVPNYKKRKGATLTPADTLAIRFKLGEAYYLRAWFYYHLINIYAQEVVVPGNEENNVPGVILFTSDITIGDREQETRPRNTVKECWDYVINDLRASLAQLTDPVSGAKKTWTGADKGRIDYFAAEALLGKALMYEERWAEARDLFLDIVNNSGKTLMPFADYYNMWNGNPAYAATETNNTEALHQITFVRSSVNAFDQPPSVSSAVALIFSVCYDNGTDYGGYPGYDNMFVHDRNLGRFGFPQTYYPVINNLGSVTTNASGTHPARTIARSYIDSCLHMKRLKRYDIDPDPRLWVCSYQPWVDSITNSGLTPRLRTILPYGNPTGTESEYQHNAPLPDDIKKHAWSLRKFNLYDAVASQNPRMHGADYYFTRLPEVYLSLAECYWKISGNATDANAIEYINKVHRRAWDDNPSVGYNAVVSNTPITKANPHPNTANPSFTDQLALNALYYEQWAEIFGEVKWWYNVRRWKLGPNEVNVYQRTRAGSIVWAADDHQYAMPIPQRERDRNSKCSQNLGY
ncbi:hypothetical protein AGMMS50239_09570 [Bacteroidia bacterium]|nr:hypothetical protein AGMMS50239_09570 [Bacteroidia bacterium]